MNSILRLNRYQIYCIISVNDVVKYGLTLLVLIVSITSCDSSSITDDDIVMVESEMHRTNSHKEKQEYLEVLFYEDQKLRQGQSSEIILKHGVNSDEFKDFVQIRHHNDELNLLRVKYYLKKHGYPLKKEFDEITLSAIPTVIHHAPKYKAKLEFIPTLYKAYEDGNIDSKDLSFILNRMHEHKFGKRIEIEGTYTPEKELQLLTESLNFNQE